MGDKRGYTMSPAAHQQRINAAAKSTGPTSTEGKAISSRNAWKHGLSSAAIAEGQMLLVAGQSQVFGKPCLSTCPKHPDQEPSRPCTLVEDGATQAGGDCLDKEIYVRAFDALMSAMADGELESMHAVLASNVGGAMELLQQLREEIRKNGMVLTIPVINKQGNVVEDKAGKPVAAKFVSNPAMAHYIHLLDKLGMSLGELLSTPRAARQAQSDEDKTDALQDFLGVALGGGGKQPPRKPIDVTPGK